MTEALKLSKMRQAYSNSTNLNLINMDIWVNKLSENIRTWKK